MTLREYIRITSAATAAEWIGFLAFFIVMVSL